MDNSEKREKRRRTCLVLLLINCLFGAALLFLLGYYELKDRKAGEDFYKTEVHALMATPAILPEPTQAQETEPSEETALPQPSDEPAREQLGQSEKDFAAMQAEWPDVKGWVKIDDTRIDYPVVQGEDNIYYLNHLPNKTRNAAGAIMMDMSNQGDFSDMITILHGHHMKSGNMFGDLDLYLEEAYYLAHPTVKLYTPKGDCTAEIFAVCHVDATKFQYPISFADAADFDAFVQDCIDKTPFDTGIVPQYGDQLLMLSTCAYVLYDDARLLVIARINPT